MPIGTINQRKAAAKSAGSSYGKGSTDGTPNYASAIAALAERLAPGGEVEQGEFSRIDREAQMMANRMEGANIARGLGNATLGVAPTATRMGMEAKGQVRNDLLGQYLSTLQFLVNASMQQQSLDAQTVASRGPSNASQGLDAFGKPMSGTLAEAEMNLANAHLRQAMNPDTQAPSPSTMPSLYASGSGGFDFDFGMNPYGTYEGGQPMPIDRVSFGDPLYGNIEGIKPGSGFVF